MTNFKKVKVEFFIIVMFFFFLNGCTPPVVINNPDKYIVTKKLYYPQKKDDVLSYFKNGKPFGALKGENCDLLVLLEPVKILDVEFFKLWLLYQNLSDNEFLLNPQKDISLIIYRQKLKDSTTIIPTSPTILLNSIEDEKERKQNLQVIGGIFKLISVASSNLDPNKLDERTEKIADKSRLNIFETGIWYDIFANSINNGILRRNTLFKEEGVNGNVYFEIPLEFTNESNSFGEFVYVPYSKCIYKLIINTAEGIKTISFIPIEDE